MTQDFNPEANRITELHADLATVGLSHEEFEELTLLQESCPYLQPDALEYAAALIDRALDPGPHPAMPPTLHARVQQAALRYCNALEPHNGAASDIS